MRDKVLIYAVGISVVVHLVVISVVGITSGKGLATASVLPIQKTINVDLVANPDDAFKPQPKALPEQISQPQHDQSPTYTPIPNTTAPIPRPTAMIPGARPNGTGNRMAGNPGGKINTGSVSANGDLPGNWAGGRTPSGYVPGGDNGQGIGSGNSAGVGTPEPPAHAVEGPGTSPSPVPAAPRMTNEKVCDESGLLPNQYCKRTHTQSFVEGSEPARQCNTCKAPEPEPVHRSTIADRAKPEILRDVLPSVPALDEDVSVLTVGVEYTVTADGDVTGVQVTKSSGIRAVDKAVIKAASEAKFKPAIQGGIPRSVKMTRTFVIN